MVGFPSDHFKRDFPIETADGEDASSIIHLISETDQHTFYPAKTRKREYPLLEKLPLHEGLGEVCSNILQLALQVLA